MKKLGNPIRAFWKSEDGIGTLEIILIIAIVILIALLFKGWIMDLIDRLLNKAESQAETIFD